MQKPFELVFRDLEKSPAIEELANEKVAKLERICDYMIGATVVIEKPQSFQQYGNPYQVTIVITVPPGKEIVVKREPAQSEMHDPLDAVVRDAFEAVERQLKRVVEKQRGETKEHPDQQAAAIVEELVPEEDYGFLQTVEGRRIYFHRNSVLNNDFDRMERGTGVRYVEELGEKGPQASTVQIVDKPGSRISE